jgi:hypothetical protein
MENLLFNGISVAYLDPGAGSLLMQALAGGSAGLIVFVRHLWNQWQMKRCVPSPGSRESYPESQ